MNIWCITLYSWSPYQAHEFRFFSLPLLCTLVVATYILYCCMAQTKTILPVIQKVRVRPATRSVVATWNRSNKFSAWLNQNPHSSCASSLGVLDCVTSMRPTTLIMLVCPHWQAAWIGLSPSLLGVVRSHFPFMCRNLRASTLPSWQAK